MELNLAVIGCGYWGNNVIRVLSELRNEQIFNIDLVLYDIKNDRSKDLASKYKCKQVKSYEEILSDPKITAILIITPTSTHYDLGKRALESGKHVFIEKPITLEAVKTRELYILAKNKKLILMVGLLFRFHQGLIELKKRIDLGEFGKIYFLYGFKFGMSIPKEDSGVIFTLAVNEFDSFCHLMNVPYPNSINAQKGTFINTKMDYEDIVNVEMDFPNGTQGYFVESWLVPVYGRRRELIVVGSKKTAIIDYLKPNEIVIHDVFIKKQATDSENEFVIEEKNPQKLVFKFMEPLKVEIQHFLDCVSNNKDPIINGEIAYRSIRMCEIAMKSSKEGKKIDISKEKDL